MKLSTKEKNFVQCLRVARVATVASDGVPHNVPVCPVFENNKIWRRFGAALVQSVFACLLVIIPKLALLDVSQRKLH